MTFSMPTRRTILRGSAASLAVPLFETFNGWSRRAHAATGPKRLVVFFSPNGTIQDAWRPKGGETDFQLSEILTPLEKHREHLIVVGGLHNKAADNGPGSPHATGMGCLLTGTELANPGPMGNGISFDQEVAGIIGKDSRFKSLQLGVKVTNFGIAQAHLSYAGPKQALQSENDPGAVFKRLFGQGQMTDASSGDADALAERRQAVLDAVLGDLADLRKRLGRADVVKLEQHVAALQDIETRLQAGPSASCESGSAPAKLDIMANDSFPKIGQLQMDLTAAAFACDLTRVVALQWDRATGNVRHSWAGVNGAHHDLSHKGDANTRAQLIKVNQWYALQLGYLIEKLAAIPEGDGTVLDNTIIMWCNELDKGGSHSHSNLPFVLAGGRALGLRTGRFIMHPGRPHNDLLVALLNLYGPERASFGNPKYVTGALSGLV